MKGEPGSCGLGEERELEAETDLETGAREGAAGRLKHRPELKTERVERQVGPGEAEVGAGDPPSEEEGTHLEAEGDKSRRVRRSGAKGLLVACEDAGGFEVAEAKVGGSSWVAPRERGAQAEDEAKVAVEAAIRSVVVGETSGEVGSGGGWRGRIEGLGGLG